MISVKNGTVKLEGGVLDIKIELIRALRGFKEAMELEEVVWEQMLNEIIKAAKMPEEEFLSYISEEERIYKAIREHLIADLIKEMDDLQEECEEETKGEKEEAARIAEEVLGLIAKARKNHDK